MATDVQERVAATETRTATRVEAVHWCDNDGGWWRSILCRSHLERFASTLARWRTIDRADPRVGSCDTCDGRRPRPILPPFERRTD